MNRAPFISFEGGEGCGKTTQIRLLESALRAAGREVLCLREPGGTPLGESVRHLLKHDEVGHGMSAEAELLLFTSSRAELVRKRIAPALDAGTFVICDRFLDSTTVYQGHARGLDAAMVGHINAFAVGPHLPSLTLVLDIDWREARGRMLSRTREQGIHDRMENEPDEFYRAVAEGYHRLAAHEPDRVKLVPAHGSVEEVTQRVRKEVAHAFPGILD